MTSSQIIAKYPREVVELATNAISIIQQTLPKTIEFPDEKANIIGFGYSNKYIDLICTIILSQKGIKIGLNKGADLPDPHHLLQGTGKVHRYIQIYSVNDLDNPGVVKLLKAGDSAWKKRIKTK